jgi:selenide,water dikinase|tara:strand:+ start:375 stop:1343 length:969 start_codon:yes stop_codon:yes gene_type:complete
LNALLAKLSPVTDPNLIVGFDTNDDAGVYRLTDELAVITTADFITPPFDDPLLFGRIGAANALSDVFAMGGRPLTCLNLVCFPADKLGGEVLANIIMGARRAIEEAGAVLVGGHTVSDPEPKFGLAVTGVVHPEQCWTNAAAEVGDALVLTKPIGSGGLLNANLKGWVSKADVAACTEVLTSLNRASAETARGFNIHAATDVTGFGLAGHGLEMAKAAGLTLELVFDEVPLMNGALGVYERGMSTGSNASNRESVAKHIELARSLSAAEEELLYDPQTNGGLLFALPEAEAVDLVARLHDAGVASATRIGSVLHEGAAIRVC